MEDTRKVRGSSVGLIQTSIRIPRNVHGLLLELAAVKGKPINTLLNLAVRRYVRAEIEGLHHHIQFDEFDGRHVAVVVDTTDGFCRVAGAFFGETQEEARKKATAYLSVFSPSASAQAGSCCDDTCDEGVDAMIYVTIDEAVTRKALDAEVDEFDQYLQSVGHDPSIPFERSYLLTYLDWRLRKKCVALPQGARDTSNGGKRL